LGVCVNSLPQLPSASHGLPVAFVIRLLLAAKNLTEASRLVLALPHATNQNYMLAEPGAVRAFEASAAGVNEFRPVHPGRILHTNHPLAADKGAPETADQRANSVARLHALTNRLGSGAANLANIKDALSSYDDPKNPVSRMWNPQAGLTGFTTGSMISALREGVRPRTWVSAGPPHLRGYEEIVVGEPAPA
ncbi:MAG: carcinine hydrolase/isopenicillin-N N-acyltransferase family protein, partial [Caulobacteraceae bacterium]